MILRASSACILLLLAATPARADVLEIGHEGVAQWIAGPLAVPAQSPRDAETGAATLPDHLAGLADAEARRSTGSVGRVPPAYAAKVGELAARYDLSPALIEALVWQESRWRPNAVSPAGARGLAQLMPGTARELGVNSADPDANLEGGARYLRAQMDRFGGDIEKALAAYNAGPGRVQRAGGIPAIRETQSYVAAIIGRLSTHSRSSD